VGGRRGWETWLVEVIEVERAGGAKEDTSERRQQESTRTREQQPAERRTRQTKNECQHEERAGELPRGFFLKLAGAAYFVLVVLVSDGVWGARGADDVVCGVSRNQTAGPHHKPG